MSDGNNFVPPKGDLEKAEKYVNQLVDLLNQQRIEVSKTDLKKFDPTSLADHYTITLKDYQIELSHSKNADSGKSSYVMIFNNLKNISEGSGEKVILAYIHLADSQFSKFKIVADSQIEERRRAEEAKRFREAVEPIDHLLDAVSKENRTQDDASNDYPKKDSAEPKDFSGSPPIYQI